jgi:hypothetical protein
MIECVPSPSRSTPECTCCRPVLCESVTGWFSRVIFVYASGEPGTGTTTNTTTVTVHARRDHAPEAERTRFFALQPGNTRGIRLPHDFGTHIFQLVFSCAGEEDLTLDSPIDTRRVAGHDGNRTTTSSQGKQSCSA